jgi:RNA polymerase-binding transcription factor DksA
MRLWTELTRQRAMLLARPNLSLAGEAEPEVYSDEADLASSEVEQDLALQVKTRMFARLRHIERALQLMRTTGYGQCRRCQKAIPYERLRVQPDAFYCVPCLTLVEQEAGRTRLHD